VTAKPFRAELAVVVGRLIRPGLVQYPVHGLGICLQSVNWFAADRLRLPRSHQL
jgi:hypothetical protein